MYKAVGIEHFQIQFLTKLLGKLDLKPQIEGCVLRENLTKFSWSSHKTWMCSLIMKNDILETGLPSCHFQGILIRILIYATGASSFMEDDKRTHFPPEAFLSKDYFRLSNETQWFSTIPPRSSPSN